MPNRGWCFLAGLAWLVALATTPSRAAVAAGSADLVTNAVVQEPANEADSIKQKMSEECRGVYSGRCMKLGLLKLLSRSGSYRLTSGLTVTTEAVTPPEPGAVELSEPGGLDRLLLRSLGQYLGSVSLNVKVMEKDAPARLAHAYYGDALPATGRKKDKYGGALAAMGLMSGGTMLALGMSALAAMAGKALMASMLALMLAAIAALKGGGEEKTTTYEVISKPHVSHVHSHSSEVQHGHGHYRRRKRTPDEIAFARQIPSPAQSAF